MDEFYDLERALKGKRKGGTIEDWLISEPVNPIEGTGSVCLGRVVDDDVHGTVGGFHTSEIINHYVEENIIETRNTFYTLGKPHVPRAPLSDEEQKELDDAVDLLSRCII